MRPEPTWVWGLPLCPMTRAETVEAVADLIEAGRPGFFITANVHYAMLSRRDPSLRALNDRAAFVLADGAPLVWGSRWRRRPLPERVTGSDLIYDLNAMAAARGYRVYFHGGAPGIAEAAAENLRRRFPGLVVAGTDCPPFRPLTDAERDEERARIRAAAPHLLFTANTMPRGERWVDEQRDRLGVPVLVNVGASFDFAAGRVSRAPHWVQRIGMEWAYRVSREPRRLAARYARNGAFVLKMAGLDLLRGPRPEPPASAGDADPVRDVEAPVA